MSQFIESIKIKDRKPFLLSYHQKRVDQTFENFGHDSALSLQEILDDLDHDENGLYKLRIVYDLNKNFRTQIMPYAFPQIHDFELVVNDHYDYAFKSEDRRIIDEMKRNSSAEEIIIVKNNTITDTSYANLLFLKDKKWYTPTTYLLNGVQRQHLLDEKKIKEVKITLDNIKEYTHFQIINAMNTMDNDFIYPIDCIINLPSQNNSSFY